jgi:hypothetical protein
MFDAKRGGAMRNDSAALVHLAEAGGLVHHERAEDGDLRQHRAGVIL